MAKQFKDIPKEAVTASLSSDRTQAVKLGAGRVFDLPPVTDKKVKIPKSVRHVSIHDDSACHVLDAQEYALKDSPLKKYCTEDYEIQRNREGISVRNREHIIIARTCPFTKDFCEKPEVSIDCYACTYKQSLGYEVSPVTGEFIKKDSGKLKWSLLPFEELKDVVRVLMKGAEKYSADNWKKCDDVTRYKDALMRHVIAYVSGEKEDYEFGLSHLAHAVCNCLFLMWFDHHKKEEK